MNRFTLLVATAVLVLGACMTPAEEQALCSGGELDLSAGKAAAVTGASVCVPGSSAGAQYTLVAFNSVPTGGVNATVTIQASGIAATTGVSASVRSPEGPASSLLLPARRRSDAYDGVLRDAERRVLSPRMSAARAWSARQAAAGPARSAAAPMDVGDPVQLNANTTQPCESPAMHSGVVQAVGTRSIVISDNANPPGGFTQAEYQSVAAQFDTLIYPLVTTTFGTPSDIDTNGKVVLFFTRAVNELTPANVEFFVGGFFFARDLFPTASSGSMQGCAGSNVSEMFYLMVPDPVGTINGNDFSKTFVTNQIPSLLTHEFQHLVNGSRRLYVNTATEEFEDTWLDEGISHSAEELLFYRQSGLSPRSNIGPDQIRASNALLTAFNNDIAGDFGSLISFMKNPSANSPYSDLDSLATRGSAWSFLRFAMDQKGSTDGNTWFQLTNSTVTGRATLAAVFGADVTGIYRRWTASLVADDVSGSETDYQQKSWQLRSLVMALNDGTYPLKITRPAADVPSTATLVPGGAAYFTFNVGSASATVAITAPATTLFTLVRTN